MKYVGKQRALALAMMAMFASSGAYAAVNINVADNAVNYAKELTFDDTTTANFSGSALNLISNVGRNLATSTTYYFRFSLSSGAWATTNVTPSVANSATDTTAVGDVSFTTSNFGATASTLIVPVSVGTVGVISGNVISLDFGTNPVVSSSAAAAINGDVTVSMSVHPGEIDAQNNTNALALTGSFSTQYITFSGSTYLTSETDMTTTSPVIDVVQGSKFFTEAADGTTTDAKTVELCSFAIGESTALLTNLSTGGQGPASDTGLIEASAAGSLVRVKGNFDALADGGAFDTATAKGRLFLTTDATTGSTGCSNGKEVAAAAAGYMPATTLSATEATFVLDNKTLGDFVEMATPGNTASTNGATEATLCMTANGTTSIVDGSFAVTYEPVGATGYSVDNIAFNKCSTLTKNGSTFKVPLVLTPTSAYRQFIRVTNPSSTRGMVHIKAYNDNGAEGTQTMNFMLEAGQSSGVIPMTTIATETGVSVLDTTNGTAGLTADKFRLVVEAEFGTGANGEDPSGVVVRSYAQTKDRNGFSEFQ